LRPKLVVTADGSGVVSHAGARLRQRNGGHSPGRVGVDVAVMPADGGEAISDLAVPA
jgi:hypothetical protein